jgi:hypothetical protein
VTSLDVNAVTSNSGAEIVSITGNDSLQEGANTIRITVRAENGATAVYTITVTREAGAGAAVGSGDSGAGDSGDGDSGTGYQISGIPIVSGIYKFDADTQIFTRYEPTESIEPDAPHQTDGDDEAMRLQLENERIYTRMIIIALAFIIVVLILLLIYQRMKLKHAMEGYEEEEPENDVEEEIPAPSKGKWGRKKEAIEEEDFSGEEDYYTQEEPAFVEEEAPEESEESVPVEEKPLPTQGEDDDDLEIIDLDD